MVKGIKFSGGDKLKGFEKKVHQAFMVNELRDGYGAYQLSYAEKYEGGNSGLSFGGNQLDLASGGEEVQDIFMDILEHALDNSGNNILTTEERKLIDKLNYTNKGKKPESVFSPSLLPKINEALSSEYGINKINEAYAQDLHARISHVEQAIDSLINEQNKNILKNSEEWKLRLVDYHNQFGLTIRDEKGNFGKMMQFLNGEEVTLINKLYNEIGLPQKDGGKDIIKAIHLIKIEGELDLADFRKFIKSTDQYNKTPLSKLGMDNRHAKLDKIIEDFKEILPSFLENYSQTISVIKVVDLGLTISSYQNVKYLENGNIVATWNKPDLYNHDMALTKSYYQLFDSAGKKITDAIYQPYIYTPKLEPLKNGNFVIYHNDKMVFFDSSGELLKSIIPAQTSYLTAETLISLEENRMIFLWHHPIFHPNYGLIGRQLKGKYLSSEGEVLGEEFVIYYGQNLICKASKADNGNIGIMCRGAGRDSDTSADLLPKNFQEDFKVSEYLRCFGVFFTMNPLAITKWILLPDSETFDQFTLTSLGDGKYFVTDEQPENDVYALMIDTYHGNTITSISDLPKGQLAKAVKTGDNFILIWKNENNIFNQAFGVTGNPLGKKEIIYTQTHQSIHHLAVHGHDKNYVISWMESICENNDKIKCEYKDDSYWGNDLATLATTLFMNIETDNYFSIESQTQSWWENVFSS